MIKRIGIVFCMFTVIVCACSAGGRSDNSARTSGSGSAVRAPTQPDNGADPDFSYSFGLYLGSSVDLDLKQRGLTINYNELIRGFMDVLESKEPRISMDDAMDIIETVSRNALERIAEENKKKEETFLAENRRKPGVNTTSSGLQYEIVVQGAGAKPGPYSVVEVHYEGSFLDGTVFDSSYERNETEDIPLDQVIPGFSEGVQLMNIGSTFILYIPSALAYGEQVNPNYMPPNSTLSFKVELFNIRR